MFARAGFAQSQPTNTLSILDYGASTNASDNTVAIQSCINAAQSQGKGVWIPAGVYHVTNQLTATGILIAGAGATTSVIYRQQNSTSVVATQLALNSCTVQDLGIDGNGTGRGTNASYGINMKGVGWLVQRVQVHHSDAGMWLSGSSGIAQNCTLLQTFADGININNSGADANHAGANLTIQNCSQDGAGDDGFAITSQGNGMGWTNMLNPKILNCTSINAWYANGIRMAGGVNSQMQNCMVSNTVRLCGIETSSFGSTGYGISNGVIAGNLVYGSGTVDQSSCMKSSDSRTIATYRDNILVNSSDYGFQVGTPTYPNGGKIVFGPNNVIINPALSGIHIQSGVTGSGVFTNNSVMNLPAGQSAFANGSGSFTATALNNNWQGLTNGTYKIVNLNSFLALDAKSQAITNGTPIEQYTYNAGSNQLWTVTSLGSGQYKITGVQSGKVLDVKGQSTADGAAIQLYTDNGGNNQKWVIDSVAGTIQGVQSSKLLEVAGASLGAGALIDQFTANGGKNQQWTFQIP
ncbi:MAG TPA: RICIN domain-containing protein [Verrucomicrobiae bacterium]